MPPERHRIAYIDGLRAVAVLLVVVHHALKAANAHGLLARFLLHGNHGVDLFFVLSGFCLSYPTLVKLRRDGSASFEIVRYAAHRLVRIVPPYWLAIAATLLFGFAIVRLGYPLPDSFGRFTWTDVVKQALFFDRGVAFVSAPFWTLPVEFRWYCFFPIVLWLWTKSPKAFAAVAAGVYLVNFTNVISYDALYLAAFMLGIVAADIHVRRIRFGWWPLGVCAIALGYAAVTPIAWSSAYDLVPIWWIASFAFVVAAGELAWLTSVLTIRFLTAVGIASYSIYLVHDPIVTFACARGLGPAFAAALGVVGGFGFWYVAERPFVYTQVRTKWIGALELSLSSALHVLGVRQRVTLTQRPVPVLDPSQA